MKKCYWGGRGVAGGGGVSGEWLGKGCMKIIVHEL